MGAGSPSWQGCCVAGAMGSSSWEDRLLDMQPQMLYRYNTMLHVLMLCCMSQYLAPLHDTAATYGMKHEDLLQDEYLLFNA